MSNDQPFDAMKAVQLTEALSANSDMGQAAEILRDWRTFLEENYSLTQDQRQWLDSVDDAHHVLVKNLLQETINSGGAQRLIVAMIADHTRPGGLYHELRQESVEESRQGMRANIVIAHCDANCQNWGWGPG